MGHLLERIQAATLPEHRDWDLILIDVGGGWKASLYYDGGPGLDYIDHFVRPDGREVDFWDWPETSNERERLIAFRGTP